MTLVSACALMANAVNIAAVVRVVIVFFIAFNWFDLMPDAPVSGTLALGKIARNEVYSSNSLPLWNQVNRFHQSPIAKLV